MAGRSGWVCGAAFSEILDIVADDARFTVDDALDRLYAARPEDFTAQRTRLAADAKRSGDAAAARQIGGSRKPTAAAWVVNLLALRGTARASLVDLGARLREAHAPMDGEAIRTLTGEQRRLVEELSRAGFLAAGIAAPSAALRDDVIATLQAAVADPDVAARLGRLTKAEQWSGFGEFGTVTAVSAKRARAAGARQGCARQGAGQEGRRRARPAGPRSARRGRTPQVRGRRRIDRTAVRPGQSAVARRRRPSPPRRGRQSSAVAHRAQARVQQPRATLGAGIGEGETRR